MQRVHSSSCIHSSPTKSISPVIPWPYYFTIIQYIFQYYLFIFPYRLRPLPIKSSSNINEFNSKAFLLHQSTSTSSIHLTLTKTSRSISTQTNSLLPLDSINIEPINTNETCSYSPVKRRKFPFNRPILPSSSLFTNFFRPSSRPFLQSGQCSTKSSTSLCQRSSAASTSYPIRKQRPAHHHSSTVFRQIESEMDHVLDSDHRPRASSSSSTLLHTIYRHENHLSSQSHRSLRRRQQYQSRSAYYLTNPHPYSFRQHQVLTSTTNTNSSDSSSVFQRLNPRFFPTMSQQQHQSSSQRLNDERIVAANERKALRVLMIIFCVFVTLWTPFFICTFISAVCDQCRERISSTIWFSITWLGYSSSMANPFIYTIFSDAFRRAFTNIIICRSNDSLFSRHFSTKSSHHKGAAAHQYNYQLSYRRSPNHEYSGTSTPIQLNHPIAISENDGTIYINRCVSDSFR
jgi:hypothetical protein